MATTEERDVPTIDELLTEIEEQSKRLDELPAGALDAGMELKNTVMPLLRDLVASVGYALEDIQDLVDPIKLTGAEAQEIGTLLGALKEAASGSVPQLTNPQLVERIDEALGILEGGGDEDDDEDTEAGDEDDESN